MTMSYATAGGSRPPPYAREMSAGHMPKRLARWLSLIIPPAHVPGFLGIEGALQLYYNEGVLELTLSRFPPR
jgi:hypothetical protein